MDANDPLVIYTIKKSDDDKVAQVDKIILDPDNGVLVKSEKKKTRRSKRSATDGDASATTETPSTEEDKPEEPLDDDDKNDTDPNADPNGHSHGKINKMPDGMKDLVEKYNPFGAMFDRKRRVKIDFEQDGDELPEGTVEKISAGGGKAPGHHEGGGLTVKVDGDEKKTKTRDQRKTLNFFFTW